MSNQLLEEFEKTLQTGEKIVRSTKASLSINDGILVLTDKRIAFVKQDFSGDIKIENFYYQDIKEIQLVPEFIDQALILKLHSGGFGEIKFTRINENEGKELIKSAGNYINIQSTFQQDKKDSILESSSISWNYPVWPQTEPQPIVPPEIKSPEEVKARQPEITPEKQKILETYRVILLNEKKNRMGAIRVLTQTTPMSFKEASDKVDASPAIVAENIPYQSAEQIFNELVKVGVEASIENELTGEEVKIHKIGTIPTVTPTYTPKPTPPKQTTPTYKKKSASFPSIAFIIGLIVLSLAIQFYKKQKARRTVYIPPITYPIETTPEVPFEYKMVMTTNVTDGIPVDEATQFFRKQTIYIHITWDKISYKKHSIVYKWYDSEGTELAAISSEFYPTGKWYTWNWYEPKGHEKPGKWKVSVFVDEKLVNSISFDVTEYECKTVMTTKIKDGEPTDDVSSFHINQEMNVHITWLGLYETHKITYKWYDGAGIEVSSESHEITSTGKHYTWCNYIPKSTDKPGKWKVDIYLDDNYIKSVNFDVIEIKYKIVMTTGIKDGAPIDNVSEFSIGKLIVVHITWENLLDTHTVTYKWYDGSGRQIFSDDYDFSPTGVWYTWYKYTPKNTDAPGKWKIEIFLDGKYINTVEFDVIK